MRDLCSMFDDNEKMFRHGGSLEEPEQLDPEVSALSREFHESDEEPHLIEE